MIRGDTGRELLVLVNKKHDMTLLGEEIEAPLEVYLDAKMAVDLNGFRFGQALGTPSEAVPASEALDRAVEQKKGTKGAVIKILEAEFNRRQEMVNDMRRALAIVND